MTEKLPSIDDFYKELPSVDEIIIEEKLPSVDQVIIEEKLPSVDEVIIEEIKKTFGNEFNFEKTDKVFQVILKSSTYEILYKPKLSINIIIKEYLVASNFFLELSQTKYLNALIDKLGKNLRSRNE